MIAQVALPLPINKLFSYSLPPETATFTKPLSRIKVPFNNRSLTGFVLRLEEGDGVGLKQAQELLDCVPLVDDVCFDLCSWAAGYYVAPIGLALKYALSSSIKIEKYCVVRTEDPSVGHLNGMTLKKACVLAGKETIFSHFHHSAIRLCDVFTGKALETGSHEVKAAESRPMLYLAAVEDRKEYYLSLISRRLDEGKNVLMLLPDYRAVGGFFYDLFSRAFPGAVFWYGSSIPEKRRAETYFRARVERGRLILGSKSAVFLPLAANDLIIVERPEEDEYRNEEGFKFNAVRLAMKRAEIEGIPVVLGSAAPPVELMKSAEEGLEIGRASCRERV
jgi:primosomal protein N' (replication factor Y)